MLNSILDMFNSSTRTHLFIVWAPLDLGDKKKTNSHLTFRIFIFLFCFVPQCVWQGIIELGNIPIQTLPKADNLYKHLTTPSLTPAQFYLLHHNSCPIVSSKKKKKSRKKGGCLCLLIVKDLSLFRFPMIQPPIITSAFSVILDSWVLHSICLIS